MRPLTMKSFLGFASLLLAAASPSWSLTLGVLPAHPAEGTEFTLAVGLFGSCPSVAGILIKPGDVASVSVKLVDVCLSPPIPQVVEVPIPPLRQGLWYLRVELGGTEETLAVNVEPSQFALDVDPPNPQAGSPFTVRFSGTADCPFLGPAGQEGNLLTLRFFAGCPIIPPPPSPFVAEQIVGPLAAGDYVVQVTDESNRTLASRRLHVFGDFECRPSETALCLLNGRFRVEAAWRTATAHGAAHAHPETADSGALWFFGPNNLELLVKVLDACQTPSRTVWVFAAGLTDVEVEITVTETATGRTRRYLNPLGRAFAPLQDTAAFSCSP
jgi:hypothetical protein